jgi:hypothetical protein
MKKTVSTILIALIVFTAVSMVTLSIVQAQTIQPTITTDKTDYAPNEQVTIYGSGFSANANIKVEVTAPDSTGNAVLFKTSDSTGTFVTTYGQPPPISGRSLHCDCNRSNEPRNNSNNNIYR